MHLVYSPRIRTRVSFFTRKKNSNTSTGPSAHYRAGSPCLLIIVASMCLYCLFGYRLTTDSRRRVTRIGQTTLLGSLLEPSSLYFNMSGYIDLRMPVRKCVSILSSVKTRSTYGTPLDTTPTYRSQVLQRSERCSHDILNLIPRTGSLEISVPCSCVSLLSLRLY